MSVLTRRNFIAGAGAAAAALGTMSAVALADAPAGPAPDGAQGGQDQGAAAGGGAPPMASAEMIDDPDWRVAPTEEYAITQTYDCEVLVCGTGYAGATALRKAAVGGKKVIGFDKQWEEAFTLFGGDIAETDDDDPEPFR